MCNIGRHINHQSGGCKSANFKSRLTESDAGSVSTQHVVERQGGKKVADQSVVQRKKESSKSQKEVHKKQSKQSKIKRNVVPQTAKGEHKMNKKNWTQKVVNFATHFVAKATLVATLNAGLSVAP